MKGLDSNIDDCRSFLERFTHFTFFTLMVTALFLMGARGQISKAQATVTQNQCSQTADIILTSDRTQSIVNSGDLTNVRNSTVSLANSLLSISGNRVGFVAFGGVTCNGSNVCTNNGNQADLVRALAANNTSNNNQLIARINSTYSSSSSVGTHYKAALEDAQTGINAATNPNKVIVFFTDGQNDDNAAQTTTLANTIKNSGVRIFTVGFNISSGSNADNVLKGIASSPTDAYLASAANLTAIFNAISSALSCDDHVACTVDACNTQSNTCTHTPASNCQACEDVGDCDDTQCVTAQCVKGQGENEGKCVYQNAADHSDCDDDNECTVDDQCLAGTCTPGTPKTCDAPGECQVSNTCNPDTGACEPVNKDNGTSCADSDKCDGDEVCSAGQCVPGTPVTCGDPATCFKDGVCQPATGTCTFDPQDSGTACGDPTSCNGDEVCDGGGHCNPGTPVTCDCEGPCQVGRCDEVKGCVCDPVENGTSCEDGNVCNGTGACQDGQCNPGTALDCNDGDACTADACDVSSGCQHEDNGSCEPPPPPSDCDNGTCDEGESCGTCPQDCGECPPPPGGPENPETPEDPIRAQQLKCAQDLVAESDGRLNAQQAEKLAGELIAEGVPCTLILESGSGGLKVGGCAFQAGSAPQIPWAGLAALILGWMPIAFVRRAKARR